MVKLKVLFRYIYIRILLFFCRFGKNSGEAIMFIPHSGVSQYDLIDLFNYRSDSAMTFANYLLENGFCKDKEFIIFVPSEDYVHESYRRAKEKWPQRRFTFLTWNSLNVDYHRNSCIKDVANFCHCVKKCSHIFNSITYRLEDYVSNQIVVDLNYYSAPFKNDLLPVTSKHYMNLEKVGKKYTMMMLSSELSIRVMMPTMSLTREQYSDFGLCRNDNLLNKEHFSNLKNKLLSTVSYKANKIFIYIPTHRDYEKETLDVTRSLFGYSIDLKQLDAVLRAEGIIIICKIHPHQNKNAFSKVLPESIKIHQASREYGLYELMKISDCMIGDYSSGYFDYLLLDKPVIFNFYDVDKYKEERGFTYNPIESIVAGEIVKNTNELIAALKNVDKNDINNRSKRAFVRDLFFTYQDANCCKRVYDYFFCNN